MATTNQTITAYYPNIIGDALQQAQEGVDNQIAIQNGTYGNYVTAADLGADYSLGGQISNWFTGKNTYAEAKAEAINAKNTENFNAQEAQKTRDWEEYMSNTSYQRMIADAEAAGINPLYLTGAGGASTNSGSTASSGGSPSYGKNSKGSLGQAASNVMSIAKTAMQIALLFAMLA